MARGLRIAAPALIALAVWPAEAIAKSKLSAPLQRAITTFNEGDDLQAQKQLQLFLAQGHLASSEAARAHLYLGLIHLNALRNDAARDQFTQALSLDSTLELPLDASPKAAIPFRQARVAAQNLSVGTPPPAPATKAAPPAPPLVVTAEPTEAPAHHRSYAIPLATGAVALASLATGAVFLGFSAGTLSQAYAATDAGKMTSLVKTSADEQSAANWLLGAGAGVAVVAGTIFLIEALSGDGPSASTASKSLGLALEGVRF